MCAINLPMVMMSRTRGMLCSVTLSCVSSAAAIAGNAEFFAPLMTTVPWRGFPPRIRNLSMRVPCPSRNSFAERLPQIAAGADQAAPRLLRADRALQHHERQAHIVSRDRKSTRLNSSHLVISYAVFCLKKKKTKYNDTNNTNTRESHI